MYIIEHLDPKLWDWSKIEYKHIVSIVGKSSVLFTNLKSKLFPSTTKRVSELKLINPCVLDPNAEKLLTPSEAKKFSDFIFGGVLGDNPPRARTKEEITSKLKYESRNLGKAQFSTDTAVLVTKMIVDGTPLDKIPFIDSVEIELRDGESTILPYKYVLSGGKPVLASGLVEYLKKRKEF